ncbi:galactosyltransferase-related protein [Acuticoccus sp. MNP-M23]|uniref:glycosyltransferase family 2 protein n=1 Tax=Acuticoccus sp. MNP-M23 TaxID=3072793 RepID=UPI0028150058|nr:galactosyltransferase-related protein [Acuticoccus sp. MNP-M23]WMS44537.1 galactosyltransferase-related protein [Acuticoccus sp. MNP-M23]
MTVSVCTIARGRERHLCNLINGLAAQSLAPAELIIGAMQEEPFGNLPETPFPIRQVPVPGERIPLAAARNVIAACARGVVLVFLDVDCVPGRDLVRTYADALAAVGSACVMGDTHYLAERDDIAAEGFDALWPALAHPARGFGPVRRRIANPMEFWSLSFALPRETFAQLGGFDPRFEGYGGEDTDFAMTLDAAGIPLVWAPAAAALHQWHAVHIPPLHQLDDIVRNANLFHQKHGRLCMDYWLNQFDAAGFISGMPDGPISIRRRPLPDDLACSLQDGSVRFS